MKSLVKSAPVLQGLHFEQPKLVDNSYLFLGQKLFTVPFLKQGSFFKINERTRFRIDNVKH